MSDMYHHFIDFLGFSASSTGTHDYNGVHDFIDNIYRVRHVKIIRILTNGLTKNKRTPASCEKVKRTVTHTAAHGLLKCSGPEQFPLFSQNRIYVLHIIFASFVKNGSSIFLGFALIQVLIEHLYF